MIRNRSDDINSQQENRRPLAGAALKQTSVTEALTRALFDELARVGYGALSLEAVAKRAGVGKAALYRRWPSKLAMVSDLLTQMGVEPGAPPDTGSLQGDVRALLGSLRRMLRHPLVRRILPDLHAEMLRTPELAAAIRGRLQKIRRERSVVIFQRAIERGEVSADIDIEMVIDAMGSMIYWRMIVTGGRASRQYLDQLTNFIVAAILASSKS